MRILLVEDDRDLQRLLKKALTDAGYVVDAAADGEEGHFLGDTEPYDAVILDLGLPKMDGVRVLEQWRKSGKTMPVLILTARDRWSDKVAGFDAGAGRLSRQAVLHRGAARPPARAAAPRRRHRHQRDRDRTPAQSTLAPAASPSTAIRSSSPASNTACSPISPTKGQGRFAHRAGGASLRSGFRPRLNTIEVFVGRLRKKLDTDLIQTIRGLGYSLDDPKKT